MRKLPKLIWEDVSMDLQKWSVVEDIKASTMLEEDVSMMDIGLQVLNYGLILF